MEYSCQTYELKCNECGRRFGNRPLSGCPECLAPLEIHYDLRSHPEAEGRFTRAAIAAGSHNIWRYAALLPIPAGFEPDLPVGFTPLVARQTPRQPHRRRQSLHQERRRLLPDPLLQGPRRLRRAGQRAGLRLQSSRLLLDRQPRQLSRRAGRAPRPRRHHPGPGRSRARQNPQHPRLRRAPRPYRRQLRPRQPPLHPRSPTSSSTASSTSTCALTTPRAPRPRATKSPSSSAGACPTTSSAPWPAVR